jgi:hypothetical protein
MKVIEIIQNEIALAHPEMHKTRLNTLFTFVHSGLKDQRLTVTYLGRGLKGLSKTDKKHDIKRADRLCGNTYLHSERIDFYKYMAESLIVNERHPLLIVDWSPINGSEIFVKGVHIVGSGDALQTNGSACFDDVRIDGGGDMILGRGPAFFKDCDFYSPGPFMWTRNTKANHGNVFLNCRFTGTNPNGSTLARAPDNKGFGYPYSECVFINCSLKNILPKGWGTVGEETKNMHYWEYNSTNIDDGKQIDLSQRADFSRQLRLDTDKKLIENYSNPLFVLDGWSPYPNN